MDREIDDEITSHLAEATEEYVQQGLSPEEARLAAQRSFGGVTQTREVYREVRSFMWLEDLARDLRHSLRTLRKNPAFTAAAAATLALAIGANTAMFSQSPVFGNRLLGIGTLSQRTADSAPLLEMRTVEGAARG